MIDPDILERARQRLTDAIADLDARLVRVVIRQLGSERRADLRFALVVAWLVVLTAWAVWR